jgi:hypothetical protein
LPNRVRPDQVSCSLVPTLEKKIPGGREVALQTEYP